MARYRGLKRIRRKSYSRKRKLVAHPDDVKDGYRKAKKYNRKYKILGPDMTYLVSPYDAIPGLTYYSKAKKFGRGLRATYAAGKRTYRKHKSRGKTAQSSTKGRRMRRGKYYYYRGKRIYRRK